MSAFWQPGSTGITVRVKVQPKSRRPGLHGSTPSMHGPRLRIGVTASASDGEATRAACRTLAQALRLPASMVRVLQGASTRDKILVLSGEPNQRIERLQTL